MRDLGAALAVPYTRGAVKHLLQLKRLMHISFLANTEEGA